jgi:hypothetical protein
MFFVFVFILSHYPENLRSSAPNGFWVDGGERGIRTLGSTFGRTHDFQSCPIGQLGHLSAI